MRNNHLSPWSNRNKPWKWHNEYAVQWKIVPTLPDEQTVQVTLSMGLASATKQDVSLDDLLYKADKALYQAKNSGRNMIMAS